jgi:hypothetical protein
VPYNNKFRYLDSLGEQKKQYIYCCLSGVARDKIKEMRLSIDFSGIQLDKMMNQCYRLITKSNVKAKQEILVTPKFAFS